MNAHPSDAPGMPSVSDAVPESLTDPGLTALWRAVRRRLDRDGEAMARTMSMPAVQPRCTLALSTLLGRPLGSRVDLNALEDGLRRRGIGQDLDSAMSRLGHPPDPAAVAARRARARTRRALRRALGPSGQVLAGRQLWEAAGIEVDAVSAPVLTWGLRPTGPSPLASMLNSAADNGMPLHLSLRLLRAHPIDVPDGTRILVSENPSVIEAAIITRAPFGTVCTNGNPSTAVTELIVQLAASRAALRYHGDFDADGIAICRRMAERGCVPWRMGATDYLRALSHAADIGIELPSDPYACGSTPWDPDLAAEFAARRSVVHEELVVDELLTGFAAYIRRGTSLDMP